MSINIPKTDLHRGHIGRMIEFNVLIPHPVEGLGTGRATGRLDAFAHVGDHDATYVWVAGERFGLFRDEYVRILDKEN